MSDERAKYQAALFGMVVLLFEMSPKERAEFLKSQGVTTKEATIRIKQMVKVISVQS